MAQTTTATLKSKAAATARVISREFRIAWGRSIDQWPTDWAAQSTDETLRLLDFSLDRRLDIDGALGRNAGPVAQLRFTLDNHDQRFSPYNENGALYASLNGSTTTPGGVTVRYPKLWSTPCRLRMGFWDAVNGHEYVTIFSGAIDEVAESYGVGGDTLTVTALDRGMALLNKNASTAISSGIMVSDWIRQLVSTLGGIATGNTIDRSFFALPYIWLDDEPLWSEIQQAAQSDGGYAFFDELGVFRYKNAAWWAIAADSLAAQATMLANFQTFSPEYSYRTVATGTRVEYQPREPGGEQIIWRSDKTIVVPPNGETIEAKFQYPASIILTPANPGDWLPVSSGGLDMSAKIGLAITEVSAQRAKLVFTNTANQTVFIPKMQLRGLALVGGPQEQIDRDVASPLVPENKTTVSGNVYIQTRPQAELIATLTAYRMSYPRLIHQFSGVPALPWLQLGDRVTIDVAEPMTADRYGIVTGLGFSWRPDAGFLMGVDAADVAGLFEYDDYHVLAADDYGEKRVFV